MGKALSMDQAIAISKELEESLEQRQQNIIDGFVQVLQPLCRLCSS
jgi:hypothetical protein